MKSRYFKQQRATKIGEMDDNETHLFLAAPITSRGRWAPKKLLMEFTRHLGKKLLLPGLLDALLYEMDMQDQQKNDC